MKIKFLIILEKGVHARPATKLVMHAMTYQSELSLKAFNRTVNLKSIMGVLSLGIYKGETIEIEANGPDEAKAIEGISDLIISEGLGRVVYE